MKKKHDFDDDDDSSLDLEMDHITTPKENPFEKFNSGEFFLLLMYIYTHIYTIILVFYFIILLLLYGCIK
jgi:hypothetical protein